MFNLEKLDNPTKTAFGIMGVALLIGIARMGFHVGQWLAR